MFRHTFCTALHKAGIDLRMAQYLMGDSDLKTVSQVYTSIENDQIASADEKMQNVFSLEDALNDDEENT
jgi:site-specific recombinase XerD